MSHDSAPCCSARGQLAGRPDACVLEARRSLRDQAGQGRFRFSEEGAFRHSRLVPWGDAPWPIDWMRGWLSASVNPERPDGVFT